MAAGHSHREVKSLFATLLKHRPAPECFSSVNSGPPRHSFLSHRFHLAQRKDYMMVETRPVGFCSCLLVFVVVLVIFSTIRLTFPPFNDDLGTMPTRRPYSWKKKSPPCGGSLLLTSSLLPAFHLVLDVLQRRPDDCKGNHPHLQRRWWHCHRLPCARRLLPAALRSGW